jgi:hypothetical protein
VFLLNTFRWGNTCLCGYLRQSAGIYGKKVLYINVISGTLKYFDNILWH